MEQQQVTKGATYCGTCGTIISDKGFCSCKDTGVSERLTRIEGNLDRIISFLEQLSVRQHATVYQRQQGGGK